MELRSDSGMLAASRCCSPVPIGFGGAGCVEIFIIIIIVMDVYIRCGQTTQVDYIVFVLFRVKKKDVN